MIDLNIARIKVFPQSGAFHDLVLVFFRCGCDSLIHSNEHDVMTRTYCTSEHFKHTEFPYYGSHLERRPDGDWWAGARPPRRVA